MFSLSAFFPIIHMEQKGNSFTLNPYRFCINVWKNDKFSSFVASAFRIAEMENEADNKTR